MSFYRREITVDMDGLALEMSTKIPAQTLEMNVGGHDDLSWRNGTKTESGNELILKEGEFEKDGQ